MSSNFFSSFDSYTMSNDQGNKVAAPIKKNDKSDKIVHVD